MQPATPNFWQSQCLLSLKVYTESVFLFAGAASDHCSLCRWEAVQSRDGDLFSVVDFFPFYCFSDGMFFFGVLLVQKSSFACARCSIMTKCSWVVWNNWVKFLCKFFCNSWKTWWPLSSFLRNKNDSTEGIGVEISLTWSVNVRGLAAPVDVYGCRVFPSAEHPCQIDQIQVEWK